jgi:predicted small secreted protein
MSHTLKLLIGLLALLALPSLSACNTARGMGEDVQATGRAMSGTAQDVEDKVTGDEEKPKAPATTTRSTTTTTK